MRRPSRSISCVVITVALTLTFVAGRAQAQDNDTPASGAATGLFDEGVALLKEGKFAAACPKLARSQELAPNGGTLTALADCYEKNEQFASAWVAYKDLADRAHAAGKAAAEKNALAAASKLEPKISKLTIDIPAQNRVDGLVIKRDGRPIKDAELGIAAPIDPGQHMLEAQAPGKKSWSAKVLFTKEAAQKSITIPPLEADPSAAGSSSPPPIVDHGGGGDDTQPTPPPPTSSGSTQRIVGIAIGGLGIVGLGIGTVFGLTASSKNDDAKTHCSPADPTRCDADGIALDKETRDAATVSTIGFIAGGALLVGGVVLFLTAPSGSAAPAPAVGFRPLPGGGAATFGATF